MTPIGPRETSYTEAPMLLVLLLSCARSTGGGAAAEAPSATSAIPVPRLSDVACDGTTCRALADGTLVALPTLEPLGAIGALAAWDTLVVDDGRWSVRGACGASRCEAALDDTGGVGSQITLVVEPVALDDGTTPLTEAATRFAGAWNAGIAAGWRSGFYRVILGPGGGRITWLRGMDGAGQLVRSGAGTRSVRLGAATSAVSWPAWLALHPTGLEAYLIAWPSPAVRAFDPATLEPRWMVPVEGAAQGLFVDPGGRWLVVGVGSGSTERYADWDVPAAPQEASASDPNQDERVRGLSRPTMESVVVIDIATRRIVGAARGTYRRFLVLERLVLATDREVLFLNPGDPPS